MLRNNCIQLPFWKKHTFKFSADLHVYKYNHICLPNELGLLLILAMKYNEQEGFYHLLRDG